MQPTGASSTSTHHRPTLFVDAEPFSWKWFAGVPRYTARLVAALSRRVNIRFFDRDQEIDIPRGTTFDSRLDLEPWARAIWGGPRRRLEIDDHPSVALYCGVRGEERRFDHEIAILYDLCPQIVGWTFPDPARWGFEKFFAEDLARSDDAIAISHSTRADAAWLTPMPRERIRVAHPGPSLCIEGHASSGEVRRSPRVGIVVSTVEPRKNAHFLIDWFHSSQVLPRDMELWWVGKMGWLLSPKELEAMTAPPGGRRVRFLGNVPDAELCRLYRTASWSIYPSIYEGFGFPVLDALRHGTPVLTSMNSSLAEFRHPGVFFFDPYDAATVDAAWLEFDRFTGSVIAPAELDRLYSWDRTAAEVLDLAEAARLRRAATPSMRKRTQSSDATSMRSAAARSEEQGS